MKISRCFLALAAIAATAPRASADDATAATAAKETCSFAGDELEQELRKLAREATAREAKALTDAYAALQRQAAGTPQDAAEVTEQLAPAQRASTSAATIRTLIDAGHARPSAAASTIEVGATKRVAIQLTDPPPTRLRVTFDSRGRHREALWDPAVSSELARVITLDEGTWTVAVATEPSTYTQQAGTVVIQPRFGTFGNAETTSYLEGIYVGIVAAATGGRADRITDEPLTAFPRPRLTFTCHDVEASLEDARFTTVRTGVTGGLRGFGSVAPTFVTETLSILAEIAVDRARAGALRLLKDRIVRPFCTDRPITLGMLHLGNGDERALPRTCELLENLRLEDLMASARALLLALRDDVRYTIAPAAVLRVAGEDGLATPALEAVLAVLNAAIDRGSFDGVQGELMLELVASMKKMAPALTERLFEKLFAELSAKIAADASLRDAAKAAFGIGADPAKPCAAADCRAEIEAALRKLLRTRIGQWHLDAGALTGVIVAAAHRDPDLKRFLGVACQTRLAIAVVKQCSAGDCTARDIADKLASPPRGAGEGKLPYALCWQGEQYLPLPGDAATVQQLVVDGLQLIAPVVDGQGRERAKAAVRLVLQLVERWQLRERVGCDCLDTFGEIAIALLDEDYGTALGRFLTLAAKVDPGGGVPSELRGVVKLIGAVASYAIVYRDTKDGDPAAARAARKQALESIIDGATDRSEREHVGILSIGSNVGLSATWTNTAFTEAGPTEFAPSLRVPFGLRWEHLTGHRGFDGFHLGLQLVDLGQFVRSDRSGDALEEDVRWADFVSPGVELGYSLAFLGDRAVNLSIHAAYAPSIPQLELEGSTTTATDRDGVWRFGASLGYYVPFFDLD